MFKKLGHNIHVKCCDRCNKTFFLYSVDFEVDLKEWLVKLEIPEIIIRGVKDTKVTMHFCSKCCIEMEIKGIRYRENIPRFKEYYDKTVKQVEEGLKNERVN